MQQQCFRVYPVCDVPKPRMQSCFHHPFWVDPTCYTAILEFNLMALCFVFLFTIFANLLHEMSKSCIVHSRTNSLHAIQFELATRKPLSSNNKSSAFSINSNMVGVLWSWILLGCFHDPSLHTIGLQGFLPAELPKPLLVRVLRGLSICAPRRSHYWKRPQDKPTNKK